MAKKLIGSAIVMGGFLIALYMVLGADLGPGGCVEVEMPGEGGSIKRCEGEGETLSEKQVSELQELKQQVDALQIKELEENKQQLLATSSNEDVVTELDKEIQEIQQQDSNYQYLQQSDYETFKQQFDRLQSSQKTSIPVSGKGLNLQGTWNVNGYYEDGFDRISYDGTFTFNSDGTFTEKNSAGSELYGSGTYDLQTSGGAKIFLKKANLDFGFYTVVESDSNSFRVTQPFDTANLTFTK